MNGETFDEEYFMRGKESGKSLYENYRWMPELTIPMACAIVDHCGIHKGARVLDFGCARGYIVKALRGLGYDAYGVDVSEWAVKNADPEVKCRLACDPDFVFGFGATYDWIIAKDVLEHVQCLESTIECLLRRSTSGVFVVVPLGYGEDGYVVPDYDKDVTHLHRFTLPTWAAMFMRPGWAVDARYRVPGVKDNYSQYERGNGFLTCRRI